MSDVWVNDIADMHTKFGVREWVRAKVAAGDTESLKKFMQFRISFLAEELQETTLAFEQGNAEEIVDGLIDLCVVAIGTLDAFGADATSAWNDVHRANMSKEPGVKASRPNPLGLPDLIKPEGWQGPLHTNRHGDISSLFE